MSDGNPSNDGGGLPAAGEAGMGNVHNEPTRVGGGPIAVPFSHPTSGIFGDYELLEEVGRGGMGVVFKARQTGLNRLVAVKMVLAGQLASREDIQRFYSGAEAAAGLSHPGIVPVYEVGQWGGNHFFSMAFVDGESLAARVSRGPLQSKLAAGIVRDVALAIQYAHDCGIIHRDLKPANILLDADGRPHVTDFDLARRLTGGQGLTGTGAILGTPGYMAPEQAAARSSQIGPATDVYGLGTILYSALAGRPPFQEPTPIDTLMAVLEQDVAPPRLLNHHVDVELENICLKCIEKEPHRRYPSAQAVADDLSRYLAGEPVSVHTLNLLDRVARTLQRSRQDVELKEWSHVLLIFAVAAVAAEGAIYADARNGPPYSLGWGGVIRALQLSVMGLATYRTWRRRTGGLTQAERQMFSIWSGFLGASLLTLPVVLLTAPGDRPVEVLVVYPSLAIQSGLAFFVTGHGYWGLGYVMGLVFFGLALAMALHLPWAPLEFGAAWGAFLVMISVRLRRMTGGSNAGAKPTGR
jgi:predicted Ser/Thr protein kinase